MLMRRMKAAGRISLYYDDDIDPYYMSAAATCSPFAATTVTGVRIDENETVVFMAVYGCAVQQPAGLCRQENS